LTPGVRDFEVRYDFSVWRQGRGALRRTGSAVHMAQRVPGHQLPEITVKEVEVLRKSWSRPGSGRCDGPRCRFWPRPPLATAGHR